MKSHNIENLPSGLLEKIFSYIDEEALCNDIPRVCEKWKLVSSSCSSFLKSAKFNGSSVSSKDICFSLQNASQLRSVSLVSVNDIVPVVRQLCRCSKEVESLQIKNCSSNGDFIPESVLINLLLSLGNLSTVQISRSKFHSHLFYEVLATMTNVTSVNLSANDFITLKDLMMIAHNSRVKEFKISRMSRKVRITDDEMGYLIGTMSPDLVILHLDMSGFGSSTCSEICRCIKLKDLALNSARNLTANLLLKLSKLPNIKCLKIEGPTLLKCGDLHNFLFQHNPTVTQLKVLKLECFDCLQNPECSDILKACKGLKSLSLQACKCITIEGISSSLLHIVGLECLNIANIGGLTGIELVTKKLDLLNLVIDEDAFKMCNHVFETKLNVKLVN